MQAHHREDLHFEAQLARVDLGVVAADEPLLLERAHTAQAGRRGNAHALGKFDVGHTTVGLQFGQNLSVDGIKPVPGHQSVLT